MEKAEAGALVTAIVEEFGPDAASLMELMGDVYAVKLYGYASCVGRTREVIYFCWSWEDWHQLPDARLTLLQSSEPRLMTLPLSYTMRGEFC